MITEERGIFRSTNKETIWALMAKCYYPTQVNMNAKGQVEYCFSEADVEWLVQKIRSGDISDITVRLEDAMAADRTWKLNLRLCEERR